MEFIQEFTVIQGTLLTLQKKVGVLGNLTKSDKRSEEQIKTVVQALVKTLNSLGKADSIKVDTKLRQISLFFILNSRLNVCELLREDEYCGHLVDSAPSLSSDVLIGLFCEPVLCDYFHELILHCPPLLSVELLEVVSRKLKEEPISLTHSSVIIFTKAIYVKMLLLQNNSGNHMCEVDCVAQKFLGYYTNFCEFFAQYAQITHQNTDVQTFENFGEMVLSLLELVTACLKYYINPVQVNEDNIDIYKMNLTFDYKKWHQNSDNTVVDIMHKQLFSVLLVQIAGVTVDIWLEWAEMDSKFIENYSLQKYIAESMYKCHDIIQAVVNKGMESELLKHLVPMLLSMASKPRDENDEIKEADIPLLLKRIPDSSFSQKKWLIALITKYDEVFSKEECIECIERNIHLMDHKIISVFLENISLFIEKNTDTSVLPAKVKHLFLNAVRQLCLEEQLDILGKFLNRCGTASHLCLETYSLNVTKIFNSAVDGTDVCQDEKYVEFVNLCLQNPMDVMKRLLKQGVASRKQAEIMADLLHILHPLHSLHVDRCNEDLCDILRILRDIMLEHDNIEFSESSFISFVTILCGNHTLSADAFVEFNLFPLMQNSLLKQNWSEIILWLETLQVFVDGTVDPKVSVETTSLLLTLAQIMELSRKNLYSFSGTALLACEHAIQIVNIVLESFNIDKEDVTIVNLRGDVVNLVSSINLFYFFDLWSDCESYSQFTTDWKAYLLHWVHMEKCNLQPPWSSSSDLPRKTLVFELMQLLPICIQTEWRTIIQNLLNIMSPTFCEISNTFVFECLIDAVQIIAVMCSSSHLIDEERGCALSCLDFCIRNFAMVVKEELTGKPQIISPVVASSMLQKIVHLNLELPKVVQESCAGLLLNMEIDIIACVASDMQIYSNEDDEERLCEGILKDMSIGIMMMKDLKARQALARKLKVLCIVSGDNST